MVLTIRPSEVADAATRAAIVGPLTTFNARFTGGEPGRPVVLALDDADGRTVGGLCGRTAQGWLFIEHLFVPEEHRGRGWGAALVDVAEREALRRGCHGAWLDTFEFQAPGFYERLGYECFGRLPDHPRGFTRFFMKKALTESPGAAPEASPS